MFPTVSHRILHSIKDEDPKICCLCLFQISVLFYVDTKKTEELFLTQKNPKDVKKMTKYDSIGASPLQERSK